MKRLNHLKLRGFKTIRELPGLSFGPLNVLIGANGAGKSNLFSFFKLLGWLYPGAGNFQFQVQQSGGASAFLHDGPRVTSEISAELAFEDVNGISDYALRLAYAAQDTLIFADESIRTSNPTENAFTPWKSLGSGHRESKLTDVAVAPEASAKTAQTLLGLMRHCVIYQFHNTSETARIRQRWSILDNTYLKEDAANLAPFLLSLRQAEPRSYRRIVDTMGEIAPFFSDFVLDPVNQSVILQWQERGSDVNFGAHQASDGMLRIMALLALLLQPETQLPSIIILDEPELGLHPYAINVIAGLLKSVSTHTQVILATQSMTLVDYFEPEQVIVVDRIGRESKFRRLDSEPLKLWLDEYSLGELWEKNVLGGRPA